MRLSPRLAQRFSAHRRKAPARAPHLRDSNTPIQDCPKPFPPGLPLRDSRAHPNGRSSDQSIASSKWSTWSAVHPRFRSCVGRKYLSWCSCAKMSVSRNIAELRANLPCSTAKIPRAQELLRTRSTPCPCIRVLPCSTFYRQGKPAADGSKLRLSTASFSNSPVAVAGNRVIAAKVATHRRMCRANHRLRLEQLKF